MEEFMVRLASVSDYGVYGQVQTIVRTDTEEAARNLGAAQLNVRPDEVIVIRVSEMDFTGEGMGIIGG